MNYILYEQVGMVGVITIHRPDALNALNREVLEELAALLQQIDIRTTRCLLLTGSGTKAFVAGADIEEMKGFTRAEAEAFSQRGNDIFMQLERFPVPVIAVVNGFALGGGCELALSCDMRICSGNAKFGQPEAGLGITPGFGGTQRLPRVVGAGKAKELIFSGAVIDAAEAHRIGLVNHIYDQELLLAKGMQMAETIAGKAPMAVRNSKKAMNQGAALEMEQAVAVERGLFAECFDTEDQTRGMQGFLKKEKQITFFDE